MHRKATVAEINAAFQEARDRLARPLTMEEVRALDAQLAEVIERDPKSNHVWMIELAEKLRACGARSADIPNSADDLALYSFCAGLIIGQAHRIRDLEAKR